NFFTGPYFVRTLTNTLALSLYTILICFPAPIIFALLLNELKMNKLKRTIQTVSYLPHFISLVVICGLIKEFTSSTGLINSIIVMFGGTAETMLLNPDRFRAIYVLSDLWQSIGWSSIIYLAALSGVDPSLYDAAAVDGANRFERVLHVTLPCLTPTIVIMFILRIGQFMSVGFDKILLLYNSNIYSTADVISTFVYRKGIVEANFSYSAAVGLFNAVVNFVLVIVVNKISAKVSETSLW
ncbi:MAG: ABC transporter permease subunit, partial [Christensenella sp.]